MIDALVAHTRNEGDPEAVEGRRTRAEGSARLRLALCQSFATMGNARGWDGLIGNEENYNKVTFEALSALDRVERLEHLDEVLRASKVRMPAKKAVWLDLDYEMIIEMGGPEAARRQALAQDGREGRSLTTLPRHRRQVRQEHLDGRLPPRLPRRHSRGRAHQARNGSLELVQELPRTRALLPGDREEANLEGWEVDRLLYNHRGEFLAIIGAGREERAPDPGQQLTIARRRFDDQRIFQRSREGRSTRQTPGTRLEGLIGRETPATKSVWSGEESYLVEGATQVPIVQSIPFGYDDIDEWMRLALGARGASTAATLTPRPAPSRKRFGRLRRRRPRRVSQPAWRP